MNIADCSRIKEAPEAGWMLVYTRSEVIFEPYVSHELAKERLKNHEILEVHLFDQNTEYRCLESRSPRFDGRVETVVDFLDDENVYRESVLLEKPWEKRRLMVLNHISYGNDSEADVMGYIDNYRLVMQETV